MGDAKMFMTAAVNRFMITKMLTAAILVTMINVANAQDAKNYWVVETSPAGKSIVRIYDINNKLVKESNVARRIDINKKRERKMLNKMLKNNDDLLWSKR